MGFFFLIFFRYVAPRARSERTKWAVVMSEFAPICIYLVISLVVSFLLLSLTFLLSSNSSTHALFMKRAIPLLILATIVLFFYLLCMKIGLICFTYKNFYQFFFFSSKLILISVEITALALSYHLFNGVRHLLTDFSGFLFLRLGRKRLK